MRSTVSYAGVQKKGRAPRNIASRGTDTMPAGESDDRAPDRRRASQQDRVTRRSTGPRQLITFVDSQDPNSRSTIQRHTAHHSNAQRRDARLQSLRNISRPRILRWTRRQSAEVLATTSTSPAASNSSSSLSSLPALPRPRLPEDEAVRPIRSASQPRRTDARGRFSPEKESAVQYLTETLCRHAPARASCEDIVAFARTDEACANLLLAYAISLRRHQSPAQEEATPGIPDPAAVYLERGRGLLRARLSDSISASADANIQAVLLLIAYTADFGSFDELRLHASALRTMIDERGGPAEENYPPVIALQLRTIGVSRFHHLTLDCGEPCDALARFPRGLSSV